MDINMGYFIFARTFYAQSKDEVKKLSRLHQDYLASFLRCQFTTLQNILNSVENSDRYDHGYVSKSLRHIEQDIHRFRKVRSN